MSLRTSCGASLIAAALSATAAPAFNAHVRPDEVELQRMRAYATVQRLRLPVHQGFDPQVQLAPGGRACVFNIGDSSEATASASAAGRNPAAGRKGFGRTEHITIVEASPICVQR